MVDMLIYTYIQSGGTALTEACSQGMSSAVTVLLKAGARTDIQDLVLNITILLL